MTEPPKQCPKCSDSGMVTVPHRLCIANRALIPHPETGRVITVAVVCDRCKVGEMKRIGNPTHPTLSEWELEHDCDVVKLLADHDKRHAGDKLEKDPAQDALTKVMNRLRKRFLGK
jgi:hypothetical protein